MPPMRNTELGDTLDWPYFRKSAQAEADDFPLVGRWLVPRRVAAGIPLDPGVSDVVNRVGQFQAGSERQSVWIDGPLLLL